MSPSFAAVLAVNSRVVPDPEALVASWPAVDTDTGDVVTVCVLRDAVALTESTGYPGPTAAKAWRQACYWAGRLADGRAVA